MHCRIAEHADVPSLAMMNYQLIRDEGHRNRMTVVELEQRMREWLAGEYEAVLFVDDNDVIGYALYKREPEWVYLRQFFVCHDRRRQHVGSAAIRWLIENAWQDAPRIRVEVLLGNPAGIAFWRSVGFTDYCLTLEREA
jgi:GNAT superfamily N-acetyltransferase